MNICRECGLPIKICNALAMYRTAAEKLDRGKIDEAKEATTSAGDFYEAYRVEHRAADGEIGDGK